MKKNIKKRNYYKGNQRNTTKGKNLNMNIT